VAPEVVFTVRRYEDTGPACGRRLARNFSDHEQPTRRSEPCNTDQTQNVAEVRTNAQDAWPLLSSQAAIPATLEAVLLSVSNLAASAGSASGPRAA
jgi:hypothetical protein